MAATTPIHHQAAAAITTVKRLSESTDLNSIPSNYVHYTNPSASDPDQPIPIVDLSLLTSDDPDQKSKAIHDLDRACQEWGFFMVVNHGIPEELMRAVIEASNEFFNLPEEEKPEFQPKDIVSPLTPIRYGTSFNTTKEKVSCWRDFLKLLVHPEFHCPHKPLSLRELLPEYCERTRDLLRNLLRGLSQGLGLEEGEMEKAMDFGSGLQIFVANLYPPCPNPDVAMGITAHRDLGLLTILMQNEIGGLQIEHKGKWLNVDPTPNSILVNTCDQLEVFSNGKYKSVLHRAVVNNQKTRISIAMLNGPSTKVVVSPMPTPSSEPIRKCSEEVQSAQQELHLEKLSSDLKLLEINKT